jgi:hypothetical protein
MHSSPQCPGYASNASKPRARLSEEQVVAIFQVRSSAMTATEVAEVYGVSEKAVRDIWKGRTWSTETWHLDTSRPLQIKVVGRPKGCKDSNPRKVRKKRAIDNDAIIAMPLRPRVVHRQQIECGAVYTCAHISWQMSHSQHQASQTWGRQCPQSADSGATSCEDLRAPRLSAAWPTSSTLRHASVDDQLDEWDSFWPDASSADPFCGDWEPSSTCISSAGSDLAPE